MKRKTIILINFLVLLVNIFSNGASEAASSGQHGKYLAGKGQIIPAKDIIETGYIAQIDYNYPLPKNDDFGVYLYNGNSQLSNSGQEEIIHIGIKANKVEFEELPPLNLSFVIDTSGSMQKDEKLNWVQESFEIFINQVRDIDYISLVSFSDSSRVIFQSTKMNSQRKRDKFLNAVKNMTPGGGTNLKAGLTDGYSQVLSTYRKGYSNRVLFLTDGVGNSEGLLEMAETYKNMDINVSTIGVGTNFDVNLMVDLAISGGGSSRFISNRDEMAKIFGTELDRMIVPAAKNLKMTLTVPNWIEIIDTWGYENQKGKNQVKYTLPTLHNGDYETILVQLKILPNEKQGINEIAKFIVNYETLDNSLKTIGPISIYANIVDEKSVVDGISNYTVLKSSTMLYFSQSLKEIGNIYYNTDNKISELNNLKKIIWNQKKSEGIDLDYDDISNDEIIEFENDINSLIQNALDLTLDARKKLLQTKSILDNIGFENEIYILDNYIKILSSELEIAENDIIDIKNDIEIISIKKERDLISYIESLFEEIVLSLNPDHNVNLILSPFLNQNNPNAQLIELLNQNALITFNQEDSFNILDRENFDKILKEKELSLTGLVDINNAIEIGNLLSANYIITGNIIPMNNTVLVFARVINIETSEIEVISKVVIPINDELNNLL